ncbi:MAG: diaminopimelate epimerase [Rickettsiaceae bacterium]|nr:diaminopimelate epimerase [Rickettsiaceae bacterium]
MEIKFEKMHGLGNDFLLIEKRHIPLELDIEAFAIKTSHRRTSIGFDQLIIYEKIEASEKNSFQVQIYNSDGSQAFACGNATRCLAYLISKTSDLNEVNLIIKNRRLNARVYTKENVSVNMGVVEFDEPWMPAREALWNVLLDYLSENSELVCASIGNPHLVIFDQNLQDHDIDLIASAIEKSNIFPNGVNINFAKIINKEIVLKVYERGAHLTLACGSGACATFAAASKFGFVGDRSKVIFELGALSMEKSNKQIVMSGPVEWVASGVLYAR